MLDYEITTRQLSDLLAAEKQTGNNREFVLLDVREPWEYQTAHIEGSTAMPVGEVPSRALQELDPEARIVAVCHHGVRSMSVALWLREQGFEKAQSLRGGIDAWSADVDPTIPRY